MVYGRLSMQIASKLALFFIAAYVASTATLAQNTLNTCPKPVYLTLDTGHMQVAPLMAQILNKHQVKATFFVANEATKDGGMSLGTSWGSFWAERGKEGHEFASHTFDHTYWKADVGNAEKPLGSSQRFVVSPSAGPRSGQRFVWDTAQYCANIDQARNQIEQYTGKSALPLYRAPGGKTSAKLLAAAKSCGYQHVGWADAGFLGDELPSDSHPNGLLLKKALQNIQSGDILMAHLGIWSRKEPWAPEVLEPLIMGLKARGLCFATLRTHPHYTGWIAQQAASKPRS